MVDIGKELGKDPKTVLFWFKQYGIETRKRGYASLEHQFKKGEPSAFSGRKHTEETKKHFREMRVKDGRVPYLKNGKHWLKQEGVHSPSWKGGVTKERQSIYSSEEWKKAVKRVWNRDDATCQRCGMKKSINTDNKFHIHHLYPFADYDYLRKNTDNLVLLCRDCHLFVHSNKNKFSEFMIKEATLPEWLVK